MSKNIQKRLRHLRGIWERRLVRKERMKILKARNMTQAVTYLTSRIDTILKTIAYKVFVRSRKYRVPKCYRRREQQRLNG